MRPALIPPTESGRLGIDAQKLKASPVSITCHLSNNCLIGGTLAIDRHLTSASKKSAESLLLEIDSLIKRVGIEILLFITLTFADPLPDRAEREAIYEKFKKLVLLKFFKCGITVFDRSASGRPHFHVIVVGVPNKMYRDGFDFEAWASANAYEQRWNRSGHTDHVAKQQLRAATSTYVASANSDLHAVWTMLKSAAEQHGFGRINALPIKDAVACGFYLAKCVTNGCRENNPDDRGVRRVRFWGKFPRKVTLKFHRVTKLSTRWRGKVAFCAYVLGFEEYEDFAKRFGPRWFLYLKGIIRLVPNRVAEVSLLTPNIRLDLNDWERQRVGKVEIELLDRLERFGRPRSSGSEQTKKK